MKKGQGAEGGECSQDLPVILFTPPPYMEVLADMQTKRVESLTNFNFQCSDDYVIPVHAILFQMWIPLEALPRNLQRRLQPIPGIDLRMFTVQELAPVVQLMYKRAPIPLTEKAQQAIEVIRIFFREHIQVDITPPVVEDAGASSLPPDAKFRCVRTIEGQTKEYHYVISTGEFLEICEQCDFSASDAELKHHVLHKHASANQPGAA